MSDSRVEQRRARCYHHMSRAGRRRRGGVTVEMAISASILFLFVFAAVEFARMNMIRHTVDNAAYEGARRAIALGATAADATSRARELLGTVAIRGGEIEVDPPTIDRSTREVKVTITVPAQGNGFIAPQFFRGKVFISECQLTRDVVSSSASGS